MSTLSSLPLEILESIAAHVSAGGSVAALLPLQLSCKRLSTALSIRTNAHLFATLFQDRFDVSALLRRLGPDTACSSAFAVQLVQYCQALRVIRGGDIYDPDILPAFWTAFTMLMEADTQNRRTLDDAGLADFVDRFVRTRLYDNHINGWPAENAVNSLALWLHWLTISQERLQAETHEERVQLSSLIVPYVLMPVRYTATLAPYIHFSLPLPTYPPQAPHSFTTLHGPYPRYHYLAAAELKLYNVSTAVAVPLATIAAKLIYFSRIEMLTLGVPPHLPLTRQHAIENGFTGVGPTQQDVHELNTFRLAKPADAEWSHVPGWETMTTEERTRKAPSARWDNDWNRLTDCTSLFRPVSLKRPHYTPGTLAGLWHGRMLVPHNAAHAMVIQNADMPQGFGEPTLHIAFDYVYMRLREYHCIDIEPNQPIPSGHPNDVKHNAWFPAGSTYTEDGNELAVSYRSTDGKTTSTKKHVYKAYDPHCPLKHDELQCRGCQYRGTSEMVFRSEDARFLAPLEELMGEVPPQDGEDDFDEDDEDDAMDADDTDDGSGDMNAVADAEMNVDVQGADNRNDELVMKRRCDGIMDIVLVGETDTQHAQAWHRYRFYGRVREWDGLIALARIPVDNPRLGARVFLGYVVGGQTLVGNWRIMEHPNEPVTFEGAWVMSKRED